MISSAVIIVGAGPSGLAAAVALAKTKRCSFVVIEASQKLDVKIKAVLVSGKTLRTLSRLGIQEPLSLGRLVLGIELWMNGQLRAFCSLPRKSRKYSAINQILIEQELKRQLEHYGSEHLLLGWTVTHINLGESVVEVETVSPSNRGVKLLCEYLILADGVGTMATSHLGFRRKKLGSSYKLTAFNFKAPAFNASTIRQSFIEESSCSIFPTNSSLMRGYCYPPCETLKQVESVLMKHFGEKIGFIEVHGFSTFRGDSSYLIPQRHHRVLAIGDAAFVISPTHGAGMNRGIIRGAALGQVIGENVDRPLLLKFRLIIFYGLQWCHVRSPFLRLKTIFLEFATNKFLRKIRNIFYLVIFYVWAWLVKNLLSFKSIHEDDPPEKY